MSHPFPHRPAPPAPFVPGGTLLLTVQGSVMTSTPVPPRLVLNGWPVAVGYGRNAIPVPPGPLLVELHCRWMRRYGEAALRCTVPPNQVVPVFYAPPLHQFTDGSIGHAPVPRKGVGVFVVQLALIAVVFLLVLAAVVAGAVG